MSFHVAFTDGIETKNLRILLRPEQCIEKRNEPTLVSPQKKSQPKYDVAEVNVVAQLFNDPVLRGDGCLGKYRDHRIGERFSPDASYCWLRSDGIGSH